MNDKITFLENITVDRLQTDVGGDLSRSNTTINSVGSLTLEFSNIQVADSSSYSLCSNRTCKKHINVQLENGSENQDFIDFKETHGLDADRVSARNT